MGIVLKAMFLLCLSGVSMAAGALSGNVVSVTDGDTVKIACPDGNCHKIRLYGIDAPEIKQEGGAPARDYLNGLLGAGMVQVTRCGSDRGTEESSAKYIAAAGMSTVRWSWPVWPGITWPMPARTAIWLFPKGLPGS